MHISRKNIYPLLLLAFIFSATVGIAAMHTDDMGQMTGCPFMGATAICQMGVFEHLGIFQSMFSGIPVKAFSSALLLFVYLGTLTLAPRINSPPSELKYFTKEALILPAFNRILRALSDGIIQPKIYA